MNLLECDVHITFDDVVVVAHDADLRRICGINRNITDLNFEELPCMLSSIPLHFSQDEY